MNLKSAALFTLLGVLFASLTGSVQAAPDDTLGMAIMSANVKANGQLENGSGVVSVTPDGMGIFRIKFNRSLMGCTCSAMHASTIDVINATITTTAFCPTTPNDTVYLRTWRLSDSTASNQPFHLTVFCPR